MNMTDAKEFLRRPYILGLMIKERQAKRNALMDTLEPSGVRFDGVGVKGGPAEDRYAKVMAEVDDIDQEISRLTDDKLRAIEEVARSIEGIQDNRVRLVMMRYYVEGKMVIQIANEMSYSPKRIYQLKDEGLALIGETLE